MTGLALWSFLLAAAWWWGTCPDRRRRRRDRRWARRHKIPTLPPHHERNRP